MVVIDERQSEGLAVVRHQADAETHGEKSSPDLDNSTLRVISTIFLDFLFLPNLGELSRSSQDLFEWDSDSHESKDVWFNSPKSVISVLVGFFSQENLGRSSIRSVRYSIRFDRYCVRGSCTMFCR